MRKNLFFGLFVLLCAMLLGSCASSKIALNENSPMAVISIVGNSYIPWISEEDTSSDDDEDDGDGIINGLINKVGGASNPEVLTAVDRVDYADESFRSIIPELSGAVVVDKEKVVENETYKMLTQSFYNALSSTVRATKYKDFTIIGAKKARFLLDSIGAKSLVILDFTFRKQRIDDKGEKYVGGVVIMKVKVLDEKGREVINKVYTEYTTGKVRRYGTDYDKNTFVEFFYEAIDNAICKFAVEYMGTGEAAVSEEVQTEKMQAVKLALPDRTKKITEESAKTAVEKSEADVIAAKVDAAVKLVQKYKVEPEEAAVDMGVPVDKVLEALKKAEESAGD